MRVLDLQDLLYNREGGQSREKGGRGGGGMMEGERERRGGELRRGRERWQEDLLAASWE